MSLRELYVRRIGLTCAACRADPFVVHYTEHMAFDGWWEVHLSAGSLCVYASEADAAERAARERPRDASRRGG